MEGTAKHRKELLKELKAARVARDAADDKVSHMEQIVAEVFAKFQVGDRVVETSRFQNHDKVWEIISIEPGWSDDQPHYIGRQVLKSNFLSVKTHRIYGHHVVKAK